MSKRISGAKQAVALITVVLFSLRGLSADRAEVTASPTPGSTSQTPIGEATEVSGGGKGGIQDQAGQASQSQGQGQMMSMVLMGVGAAVATWGFSSYAASCSGGATCQPSFLAWGIAGVVGVGLSLANSNQEAGAQDIAAMSIGDVTGIDPRAADPCFSNPQCRREATPTYPTEQLKDLERAGAKIDPAKGTVTLPNGQTLPLSKFGDKDSAMKAMGLSGAEASSAFDAAMADINKKFDEKGAKGDGKDLKQAATGGGADGGGSGAASAFEELDPLGGAGGAGSSSNKNINGKRNPAAAAKGLAVSCGDSKCGSAMDDIFLMMKRQTGRQCKTETTLVKPEECPNRDDI